MAPNQSAGHQKRSRASDAAEKVSRPGEERTKRRRTSDVVDTQSPKKTKASSDAIVVSNGDAPSQELQERKSSAPWSFSRPVGGRYSNLDPDMTADEA
jgi:NET1-associated nuclear protein 1 (U3 small nucleolar RNA-associated protein 17)